MDANCRRDEIRECKSTILIRYVIIYAILASWVFFFVFELYQVGSDLDIRFLLIYQKSKDFDFRASKST